MTQLKKRYSFSLKKDNYESISKKLSELDYTICFVNENIKPTSIKDVLYAALNVTSTATYKNGKKRKQLLGSSRSIEDLFLLCKHYLPQTELKDVLNFILQNDYITVVQYCSAFRRFMFIKLQYNRGKSLTTKTIEIINKHFK